MYPYSNYPNPNYPDENPNNQRNVPPYTYPENPNVPPYPPYNYQGGPQGQPPYNYYPPQPPRPRYGYGYVHPALRAVGIFFLVIFILSLVGHHGFFFFPFFPLLIFAIIMLATRSSRYGYGWGRPHYHQRYNYWNNRYQYPGQPYDYSQTPPPPGYYGPQQPPQSQGPVNSQGWPAPKDPYRTNPDENIDNPY